MFSRVSEEKNLLFALKSLSFVRSIVEFDIIGPVSPPSRLYFEECLKYMSSLPKNIKVNYLGPIDRETILECLPFYDLALYPTIGDNFAHAVSDILRSGVKILISPHTPWNDIEILKFGKIIDIDDPLKYGVEIDYDVSLPIDVRLNVKKNILDNLENHTLYQDVQLSNLFKF